MVSGYVSTLQGRCTATASGEGMSFQNLPARGFIPKRPRKRPEVELQKQADDFLGWDGWRVIVTDPPRLRGLGVIEKGIPDRLYIRYHAEALAIGNAQACDVLWVEWKAKGGHHALTQLNWRMGERRRGALVWVAKEDFEPDYDSFVAFYRKSGLLRRAGL